MARTTPTLRANADRPHLTWPAPIDPGGATGPTYAQTRGRHWRRTSRGFYVPSSVEQTAEQRILEAAHVLPEYGGVTGWAGLHWIGGIRWFDGTGVGGHGQRPVWLVTAGDDIRPQAGIEVSAERLDPRDLVTVDGVRLTTAVRSVCFEMRYAADVRGAVRVFDMAAYYDLVSTEEVAQYAGRHSGWTGIPRCRAALPFTNENAWSPLEVDTRLVWEIDAGLPRLLCNQPLFDRQGTHIGTPDLLDVEAGVVGEYEGELHLVARRRAKDLKREERFRQVGLEYFTVVADDLADASELAERMVRVRARAAWAAEATRPWTIDPPRWWTPTHTVALRRGLDQRMKDRLLRYRAA